MVCTLGGRWGCSSLCAITQRCVASFQPLWGKCQWAITHHLAPPSPFWFCPLWLLFVVIKPQTSHFSQFLPSLAIWAYWLVSATTSRSWVEQRETSSDVLDIDCCWCSRSHLYDALKLQALETAISCRPSRVLQGFAVSPPSCYIGDETRQRAEWTWHNEISLLMTLYVCSKPNYWCQTYFWLELEIEGDCTNTKPARMRMLCVEPYWTFNQKSRILKAAQNRRSSDQGQTKAHQRMFLYCKREYETPWNLDLTIADDFCTVFRLRVLRKEMFLSNDRWAKREYAHFAIGNIRILVRWGHGIKVCTQLELTSEKSPGRVCTKPCIRFAAGDCSITWGLDYRTRSITDHATIFPFCVRMT